MEKTSPTDILAYLTEEFGQPGWHAETVARELSIDLLTTFCQQYSEYTKPTKLGILLSLVHVPKANMISFQQGIKKILALGQEDKDEWVRLTSVLLQSYMSTQQFKLSTIQWPSSTLSLFKTIGATIEHTGFGFHPTELALLQPSARVTRAHVSETYQSMKPTMKQHFVLDTSSSSIVSSTQRMQRFEKLIRNEDQMKRTTGMANESQRKKSIIPTPPHPAQRTPIGRRPEPAAMAPGNRLQQPLRQHPRPAVGGASSALFISRRSSVPAKPNTGNSLYSPKKPTVSQNAQDSNTPRGLQRTQRTQLINFDTATDLMESNSKAVDLAQQEAKLEIQRKKERALEQRRLASERERLGRKRVCKSPEEEVPKRTRTSNHPSPTESAQEEPSSPPTDNIQDDNHPLKYQGQLPETPNVTPPHPSHV
ncbi:hypothetical protein CLU79DRAFT_747754 [Phycomyces nitens]|nr:hypothetical protein CLU79DRAFT_747754 [Phycomyces nitens]